ncbi:hypothetical protein ACFW80_35245 [Streptomyces fimicarius]|uniref:DNA polymerase III subunit beta family protein n=1 Tax=Streptomyces griseus TaxID=1911 RepID=UPI00368704AC
MAPTVPVGEFPVGEFAPAPTPAPIAAHIDAQDLYRQLQRVIPAACTDDTLPTLTTVQLTLNGSTLTLAASDRYRVAVADVPATPNPDHPATTPEHPLTALIPASVLTRVSTYLKTCTGPVAIAFGNPELTLTIGDTTLTIQPREGNLPRFDAMFSTTVDTSLTLDRPTAQKALKKCTALITASGERGSPVTLRWDETGTLTLAPRIGEPDDRARIKGMPLTFTTVHGATPTARELHANPAFFKDALDAFAGADTLTLHLRDQKEGSTKMLPLLLTTGPCPTGGDYRHLLMPVRPS